VSDEKAVAATVTGNDEHVGFRAMVLKNAIQYNLAGCAKNENDDIVRFVLQGDSGRIYSAIGAIREGTKKSSKIQITTAPTSIDASLKTFTVIDWTSTSRTAGAAKISG
jgi:acylphosphatase